MVSFQCKVNRKNNNALGFARSVNPSDDKFSLARGKGEVNTYCHSEEMQILALSDGMVDEVPRKPQAQTEQFPDNPQATPGIYLQWKGHPHGQRRWPIPMVESLLLCYQQPH